MSYTLLQNVTKQKHKYKNAPGIDGGIPNYELKRALEQKPQIFLKVVVD